MTGKQFTVLNKNVADVLETHMRETNLTHRKLLKIAESRGKFMHPHDPDSIVPINKDLRNYKYHAFVMPTKNTDAFEYPKGMIYAKTEKEFNAKKELRGS